MVLVLAAHGTGSAIRPLGAADDQCLRLVFGRYGDPDTEDIEQATKILLECRRSVGGRCWLACDCLAGGGVEQSPLMTVSGDEILRPHIRRLERPGRTRHQMDCDFSHDDEEQEQPSITYDRRPLVEGRRLLRVVPKALLEPDQPGQLSGRPYRRHHHVTYAKARPPLARLLAELMTAAGLQSLPADAAIPDIGDQYGMLRNAAENIWLTNTVRLREYYHTYFEKLESFQWRLKRADRGRFSPAPPHGIFLGIAQGAEGNEILLKGRAKITLPGRITVFTEPGAGDGPRPEDAPYIAIVLYASLNREMAMPVQAYLHPVMSPKHLMLVSSAAERQTFEQTRNMQKGILNSGVTFELEKPLFSVGSSRNGGRTAAALPAFMAWRSIPGPAVGVPIDVTSSDDARYLGYKRQERTRIEGAFGRSPVIHEIDLTNAPAQELYNAEFRRRLRRSLFE